MISNLQSRGRGQTGKNDGSQTQRTFKDAFPVKSHNTPRDQKGVPVRQPYIYALLIKVSALCAILLLLMVIATAKSQQLLVEESVIFEMKQRQVMNLPSSTVSSPTDDGRKNSLEGSQQSTLGPGYTAYFLKQLTEKLHSSSGPVRDRRNGTAVTPRRQINEWFSSPSSSPFSSQGDRNEENSGSISWFNPARISTDTGENPDTSTFLSRILPKGVSESVFSNIVFGGTSEDVKAEHISDAVDNGAVAATDNDQFENEGDEDRSNVRDSNGGAASDSSDPRHSSSVVEKNGPQNGEGSGLDDGGI